MKRTWAEANADQYGQLGIIESVRLRNFMCHDNLSFDFDPHMNFIVGLNGSGKSAILTGIILALGGKSGATGRYSNIKGFVKIGKNSATVSVTLKNCGPDAYKPGDYGEKITIERSFTSDGVSSYKIKSEAGRIISNSKEELTNILTVMDIQIENPITVLTQDASKTFLKSSKGDKLFKLFYQGTGLLKVKEAYNKSFQQNQDAKLDLESKKAVLPDMEKEIKTLKALLDKSSKIAELRKELCWAMVIEFEKARDADVETLEKFMNDVSELKRKLNHFETELANTVQSVASAKTDKTTSYSKMEDVRKDLQELNSKRFALKSEIREVQGTSSRYEREVKKLESDILNLEDIVHNIKMKNQNDIDEDKLRHKNAVKNLQNKITNSDAHIGMVETKKNSLRETAEGIQKEMDACHAEIQEVNFEKSRILREKQQLIDGMKNRLNVFGPEMINVLREIEGGFRAGIFTKKPKGPIGLFVNVKQPEWNFAVQECLKMPFLKTFLCDNHADAEQLTEIFVKHFQRKRPSIITTKFVSELYDVTTHKSLCEYPTLLDMLNIEDPVITNCLIDQKQIENILLITDPVDARNLMLYNPPDKCLYAYTINGDQFCHSPFRKYSCRNKNQICILKSVNEDDIRKKEEEIKLLDINHSTKMALKEKLLQQLKLNDQEIGKLNNEITDLKIIISQLRMKLKDEENSYSEPKDISCLQNDLDDLMKDKARHEEKLTSSKEIVNTKTGELDILDANTEECKRILQIESRNFHSLSEKVENCENKKEKLDSAINKIKSQVEQIKPLLQDKQNSVADSTGTVKIATQHAESACPRINTTRSVETLRQLLKEMEKYIQQQKNCDRESLANEYEQKVKKFMESKTELIRQEKLNERLGRMMIKRSNDFKKICKNTSIALTCGFISLLKENNFVGHPDINFETETLEIFAKPEKTKSKFGNKSNLSQLSGGEKSYVTIAFLLSLWERIHAPFRILDEYDVFMDSNNRHFSIHLLINTAKANKKIQYIFLSPLELPYIEDGSHVKVHKMPAPRK